MLFFENSTGELSINPVESTICIEEKINRTLTYYFYDILDGKLITVDTISTYDSFKQIPIYLEINKGNVVKIITKDNRTIYHLYKNHYTTNNDKNPILISGEVLIDSQTTLL